VQEIAQAIFAGIETPLLVLLYGDDIDALAVLVRWERQKARWRFVEPSHREEASRLHHIGEVVEMSDLDPMPTSIAP
jgi:hypothetical protein